MQKINLIIGIYIFSSCSVLNYGGKNNLHKHEEEIGKSLEKSVIDQNISNSGYFISKAEVEFRSVSEKQKFVATIKYLLPDKYLISLRSRSGIEAARIFISKDTLLINDRINRQLLSGRPDYINKKYGIPVSVLPAVLGDFIYEKVSEDNLVCMNGVAKCTYAVMGSMFEYVIDCKRSKVGQIRKISETDGDLITLNFSKFSESGTGMVPSSILIVKDEYEIVIRIIKSEIPWEGKIEFIPGNKYEVINLK